MKYPIAYPVWEPDDIASAVDCLRTGEVTMGRRVREFESEFAQYLGVQDAVMVNSGSSAAFVMMLAAVHLGKLRLGDEVLLPAVTWPTQAWACIMAGLNVRFVDIDASTLQMDPAALEKAITPKSRGVFVAHLLGNPASLAAIRTIAQQRRLALYEDCCEALGASYGNQKVGRFGKASIFSFFHSHHLSTIEGGMIATDDAELAEACRMIRAHGWIRDMHNPPLVKGDTKFHFIGPGLNFRPTEVSGALGLAQLPKLDSLNAQRNANHRQLAQSITSYFQWTTVGSYVDAQPAWFAYPLVLKPGEDRASTLSHLASLGIDSRPIAGGNLLRQPAFAHLRDCGGPFPNADRVHDGGFYIGLPAMESDMSAITNTLLSCVPV